MGEGGTQAEKGGYHPQCLQSHFGPKEMSREKEAHIGDLVLESKDTKGRWGLTCTQGSGP